MRRSSAVRTQMGETVPVTDRPTCLRMAAGLSRDASATAFALCLAVTGESRSCPRANGIGAPGARVSHASRTFISRATCGVLRRRRARVVRLVGGCVMGCGCTRTVGPWYLRIFHVLVVEQVHCGVVR